MERLQQYARRQDVKSIHSALKEAEEGIEQVSSYAMKFLTEGSELIKKLVEIAPELARVLLKVGQLASALGPAGTALSMGVDLLVMFSAQQDSPIKKKLDEISRHVKSLQEATSIQLNVLGVMERFLPIYDKMLAHVLRFEQIIANPGNSESFCQRIEEMIKDYSPNQIIVDLCQMHALIMGETGFGKPLFEQLAEQAYSLEEEKFDEFIGTSLLHFHIVVSLEIRAVRMLRSFVAYEHKDTIFDRDIKLFYTHLALQYKEHDPAPQLEWYFKLRAFGGEARLSIGKSYLYMENGFMTGNIMIGAEDEYNHDQSVFIFTPLSNGAFCIASKRWPTWLVTSKEQNVKGSKEGFIPWRINPINARTRMVTLSALNRVMDCKQNNVVEANKNPDNTSLFHFELL